jgi:YidC/Oxa1 family membrane protein insertase
MARVASDSKGFRQMHPIAFATSVVAQLSTLLSPIGGAAAAIVVVTVLIRLAVHPLTRAAVRGERARARLTPHVAELKRKHGGNFTAFGQEVAVLYRTERISPIAGVLPMLVQTPIFLVLYRVFGQSGGPLGSAHLFGVPLSARFVVTAGSLGVHMAVFAVLLAMLAALAWWSARRAALVMRAAGGPVTLLRFMPYTLLISGALLPLAAGVYLVTTTAWSAVENFALRRGLA